MSASCPVCVCEQWLLRRAKRISVEEFVKLRVDPFLTRNRYTWDFVFVFRVYDEDDKLNQVRSITTMARRQAGSRSWRRAVGDTLPIPGSSRSKAVIRSDGWLTPACSRAACSRLPAMLATCGHT